MSSRTVSSFWNEHASATRPGNCSSTKREDLLGASAPRRQLGRRRLAASEHLLQGVAAQAEAERLERDHLLRRDVAEVDVRAEVLDEPRLARLRRRLEDQVGERDLVRDLVDQARAHVAVLAEDAGRAAFARLGDHLPGAGLLLFLQPLDPLVRRVHDVGILRADLGEHGEVAREVGDQLELAVARDVDRAVGDLDVREAVLLEPRLELVDAVAHVDDLEERAAADDRRLERAVERDLLLEVVRDVARAPAELDDVDELAADVEHAFDLAEVHPLVHHVREPFGARLAGARGQVEESVVKAGHRAPSVFPGPQSGRRGRGSCRARRCRP